MFKGLAGHLERDSHAFIEYVDVDPAIWVEDYLWSTALWDIESAIDDALLEEFPET